MGILKKPYELSIWGDTWNSITNKFDEVKLLVIGSNTMTSQSRALSPTLVENVNGTHTLTFKVYYKYKDNITGESVDNPYTPYLTNERKLKLKYGDKWYDFVIKNVKEDSNKYSYDIEATDQYINELSKNGFNLTLDAELSNNVGSAQSLTKRVLEGTNWEVPDAEDENSEFIPDRANETLVQLTIGPSSVTAYRIFDGPYGNIKTLTTERGGETINIDVGVEPVCGPGATVTRGQTTVHSETTIPSGATIYAFYSCLADKNSRFSFIYPNDGESLTKDSERVITNRSCQYYIDNVEYFEQPVKGVYIPTGCDNTAANVIINNEYRGARYVFSPDTQYNPVIDKYVTIYSKNGNLYYGYSQLEFNAPQLIQNWVTNSVDFKSTSGWAAGTTSATSSIDYRGSITNDAVRENDSTKTLMKDLEEGTFSEYVEGGGTYTAQLNYVPPTQAINSGILVNTGFYDQRTSIKNLIDGDRFICRIRGSAALAGKTIVLKVGTVNQGQYTFTTTLCSGTLTATVVDQQTWYTCELTIANSIFTEASFKAQSTERVYIVLPGNIEFSIQECEIFPYIPKEDGGYILPTDALDTARTLTVYTLYDKQEIDDLEPTQTLQNVNPVYKGYNDPFADNYSLTLSCQKRRAISIKESNYFNVIQTICETFECWAEFIIDHDNNGVIQSKSIIFKNYIGARNWAGFRYGVNLKSVSRTDDSKQIVTKLIVKQNSNEFGDNGFCTIARAPSNETGENYIYNIDYYVNQNLLSMADWNGYVYGDQGYFTRLSEINAVLRQQNQIIAQQTSLLAQAQSEYTIAEAGYVKATDEYESATEAFAQLFGVNYDSNWGEDPNLVAKITDDKNIKYLKTCAEWYQAQCDFKIRLDRASASKASLEAEYAALAQDIQDLITEKETLNQNFYEKFYRFIQEGTWNSEEYYDDEKYYLDALSTLYASAVPKVSYNISVLELSQLQGYEDFSFAVGDRTYVEDPEFFGYIDNVPVREEVVLSEITYSLDEPDKNSIKVQNFKTQFQDLFKKITATVQSVQLSTGAYDKAAQLADANDAQKSAFLQSALNDSSTILQNMGDQTVRLDADGLTIVDGAEQNKALRAVSGGILLTEDGGNTWSVGISATGINAKTLTTGTLNTGAINVMNGAEPTFRWDSFGITAYNFSGQDEVQNIDFSSGVRFDRLGVYAFKLDESDLDYNWRPNKVAEWTIDAQTNAYQLKEDSATDVYLRHHSNFELTRDGLYLNLGLMKQGHYMDANGTFWSFLNPVNHISQVQLGRVNDLLYNKWSSTGLPYYDASDTTALQFAKVLAIGNGEGNENLVIYDDGTLVVDKIRLTGSIEWTDASSPSKSVYGENRYTVPANNTPYSDFPATSSTGWHKNYNTDVDLYYCHTDNGGATWVGPMLLTGRGIVAINEYYSLQETRVADPSTITTWSTQWPEVTGKGGWYVYTKREIIYSTGTNPSITYTYIQLPTSSEFNIDADTLVLKYSSSGILETTSLRFETMNAPTGAVSWNLTAYDKNDVGTPYTGSLTGNPLQITSTDPAYTWLTSQMNLTKLKVTVTVGTLTDYVNLVRVNDGSDTYEAILSNPNLVFSSANGQTKPEVITQTIITNVVQGSSYFNYNTGTGRYYTVTIGSLAADAPVSATLGTVTGHPESCCVTVQTIAGRDAESGDLNLTFTLYENGTQVTTIPKSVSWSFVSDGARGAAAEVFQISDQSVVIHADPDGSGGIFDFNVDLGVYNSDSSSPLTGWTFSASVVPATASWCDVTITNGIATVAGTWPDADEPNKLTVNFTAFKGTKTLKQNLSMTRCKDGASAPGDSLQINPRIISCDENNVPPANTQVTATGWRRVGTNKNQYGRIGYQRNGGQWTIVAASSFTISVTNNDALTFVMVAPDVTSGPHSSIDDSKILDGPESIAFVSNGPAGSDAQATNVTTVQNIYYYATENYSQTPTIPSGVVTATDGSPNHWTLKNNISLTAPTCGLYSAQQSYETTPAGAIESIVTSSPTLIDARYNTQSGARIVEFVQLTNWGEKKCIKYDEIGNELYINADFINSGVLMVSNPSSSTPLFKADITNKEIILGGFSIKDQLNTLRNVQTLSSVCGIELNNEITGNNTVRIGVGTEEDETDWTIDKAPFKVLANGSVIIKKDLTAGNITINNEDGFGYVDVTNGWINANLGSISTLTVQWLENGNGAVGISSTLRGWAAYGTTSTINITSTWSTTSSTTSGIQGDVIIRANNGGTSVSVPSGEYSVTIVYMDGELSQTLTTTLQATGSTTEVSKNVRIRSVFGSISNITTTVSPSTRPGNGGRGLVVSSDIVPITTSPAYKLGAQGFEWSDIYVQNVHNGSDRRIKNNITHNIDSYSTFFDQLRPAAYYFNSDEINTTHLGFITQEVGEALALSNLSEKDFGGFTGIIAEPDGPQQYLSYNEFIPLNTWQIQLLKPRVTSLEERCTRLEARVHELEGLLNAHQ